MAAPPPPKGKKKGIPLWVYLVGAVGVAGAYLLYKRQTAGSVAANQQAAQAAQAAFSPTGAGSYGNSGDLASLLPYLSAAGNSSTGQGSGVYGAPSANATQQGSGFGLQIPSTGGRGEVVQTQQGTFQQLSQQALLAANKTPGNLGGYYYQPVPGFFTPLTSWSSIAAGTPLFIKTGNQ